MLYAIGAGDRLAGVTHECDFPEDARKKPVVIHSAVDMTAMTASEIDAVVSDRVKRGLDLYVIDTDILAAVEPDLIIGQGLCDVCAASGKLIWRAISSLSNTPRMLDLSPHTIGQILENLVDLGAATGRETQAAALVASLQSRISAVREKTGQMEAAKRVFFMEWTDPVYCGGHWIPEMIEIAGGSDRLGRKGLPSVCIEWERVIEWDPEVIIISSCGMHLPEMVVEAGKLASRRSWNSITAVKEGRVFAVDAGSYFTRPGPRIVTGVELLAHLLHPGQFEWHGPANAFCSIDVAGNMDTPLVGCGIRH